MTRFARAKGSKSSNERLPEKATSWSEMKQQLVEKNKEIEESKKREAAENVRKENYKAFLEEVKEQEGKESKWADFPGVTKPEKTNAVKKNKLKQKSKLAIQNDSKEVKNKTTLHKGKKDELSGSEMETDGEDLEEFNNMKSKLDEALDNLNKNGENGNFLRDDDDDSDDAPEEVSSKVEQKIQVNKSKPKKKLLKIVVDKVAENKTIETKPTNKNKRKVNSNETSGTVKQKKEKGGPQPKKIIDVEKLTPEEKIKFEKSQKKKLRQLEKRKLKKAQLKEQKKLESAKLNENKTDTEHKPQIKNPKTKDNKSKAPERKKPFQPNKMIINGKEVEVEYFDGFPIKKEDHKRLVQLRKQMISKGLPRSEINVALKLERRKAEKAFAREKKKVCFNCRQSGHNLSECPTLGNSQLTESTATGICFKCGSTEHTHFECKVVRGQDFRYAQCFICNEQGHIARQCPDNARGLYPKGGACRVCGDVTHLKKDCPKFQVQQQKEDGVEIGTISGDNPDDFGSGLNSFNNVNQNNRPNKIIKF